jgi:hypothetical protein
MLEKQHLNAKFSLKKYKITAEFLRLVCLQYYWVIVFHPPIINQYFAIQQDSCVLLKHKSHFEMLTVQLVC